MLHIALLKHVVRISACFHYDDGRRKKDKTVRDWEVFKVLTLDVGMQLTEEDKQVRELCPHTMNAL